MRFVWNFYSIFCLYFYSSLDCETKFLFFVKIFHFAAWNNLWSNASSTKIYFVNTEMVLLFALYNPLSFVFSLLFAVSKNLYFFWKTVFCEFELHATSCLKLYHAIDVLSNVDKIPQKNETIKGPSSIVQLHFFVFSFWKFWKKSTGRGRFKNVHFNRTWGYFFLCLKTNKNMHRYPYDLKWM